MWLCPSLLDLDGFATDASERPDLFNQLVAMIHRRDVVGAANALAIDHDVWHGPPASHFFQPVLYLPAELMYVQLDNVWFRCDEILVEKEGLCPLGELAVGLGEDYHWGQGQRPWRKPGKDRACSHLVIS